MSITTIMFSNMKYPYLSSTIQMKITNLYRLEIIQYLLLMIMSIMSGAGIESSWPPAFLTVETHTLKSCIYKKNQVKQKYKFTRSLPIHKYMCT